MSHGIVEDLLVSIRDPKWAMFVQKKMPEAPSTSKSLCRFTDPQVKSSLIVDGCVHCHSTRLLPLDVNLKPTAGNAKDSMLMVPGSKQCTALGLAWVFEAQPTATSGNLVATTCVPPAIPSPS